ncbi:hypothetical protein LINPERPRIM_LOCUS692 [Linum perenne]
MKKMISLHNGERSGVRIVNTTVIISGVIQLEEGFSQSGAGVRIEEVEVQPDVVNQSQQPGTQPPNTQPRSSR